MKKLLALLITMLVIGSAFSGLVHINGPGLITGSITESTLFGSSDLPANVGQVAVNFDQAKVIHGFNVLGMVADDSPNLCSYEFFGVTIPLFMLPAAFAASPDSKNFVLRDVSRSREVISLRGSKPAYTGNDMRFL
jgi:hypothetical protein